jgi:hypothetical protein
MDYAIIVLLYAPQRLNTTARIVATLQRTLGDARIIAVTNGNQITSVAARKAFERMPRTEYVQHDNTGLEFGGYQAGVNLLGNKLPERLIILNDTIGHHDLPTRTLLQCFMRQLSLDMQKFAVGMIYSHPRAMSLMGLQCSRWIRTHMFALDREALRALGCRIYQPEIDNLITASPDPEIFFGDHVTRGIRDRITEFLFQPAQYNWYAAAPLNESNCVAMAGKARSILQEKYLAMRLEAADVALWHVQLNRRERATNIAEKALMKLQRRLTGTTAG